MVPDNSEAGTIFSSLALHGKLDFVGSIFCVKTEQFVHEYFLKTYTELAKKVCPRLHDFASGPGGESNRVNPTEEIF